MVPVRCSSRRDFLKGAVTLGATMMSGTAWAASAGTDCRTWQVGTAARIDEKSSVNPFLDLEKAGLETVELNLGGLDRARALQARAWAKQAGVVLWSGHVPYARDLDPSNPSETERQDVVRRLSEAFDVYAVLQLRALNIHASYEITKPIPAVDRRARLAAARSSLATLAVKADAINTRLAVECLPRACLANTSAELLGLLEGLPSVGVTLDTNHIFQETHAAFIRALGSRIINTHIADNDGVDERHWLPGRGVIDFAPIVQTLQEVGYAGPFNFECAGTPDEKIAVWRRLCR